MPQVVSEKERLRRLSVDVTGAEAFAREVTKRLVVLGDPDAVEAEHVLQELTVLSDVLRRGAEPAESPAIVSRLLCIAARCDGPLGDLGKLVDRAAFGGGEKR